MTSEHLALAVGLFLAWNGFLVAIIKWLIERQVGSLEKALEQQREDNKALKTELQQIRVDLATQYVRKDDCKNCRDEELRNIAVLDRKVVEMGDRLMDKLEELRKDMYAQRSR